MCEEGVLHRRSLIWQQTNNVERCDDDVRVRARQGISHAGVMVRGGTRARRCDGFEGFSKGRFSYHRDARRGSGREGRARALVPLKRKTSKLIYGEKLHITNSRCNR